MSAVTQCPECSTRFKVSQAQLDMYQGMVRCGRCQAIFNATKKLHDNELSPQLTLTLDLEEMQQVPVKSPVEPIPVIHDKYDFSHLAATSKEAALEIRPAVIKKNVHWSWIVVMLLLVIVLLAQTTYFFRVELAAHLPGIKLALTSYCKLLNCDIPLPKKIDQLSIESSDLESDPKQASAIVLNAILRNRALYAQTYPNLELTLTNSTDEVLARRTFLPMEYLKLGEDEKQGLLPNHEIDIKLHLDTADLKPAGYRLFLFYP
ncbi:conserved hypothetical protein [Candidatus Nitrotoga sp. HW29]|uniref:zinc-ribbon and DUF3426 domain-containing protein n=1 Tax=Candidatus Nitrotoga sp. HW29 TaxID=2886963 RepID=UPI001EF21D1D|nr:zinc-ribbon and DUF3426 domain-containing protein [Candidatus Nitrotoga sp. HW29]CAH1903913.1 conserved hypothetical protein [Candidatus Nitrotoga sp. HW29]